MSPALLPCRHVAVPISGAASTAGMAGVLFLVVTHYCTTMGQVHTGIPMTVTSTLNAPPGSAYTEGTTVADFTRPTGGGVSIWTW